MRRTFLATALLMMSAAHAWAAGECPALPRRDPMPAEALPMPLEWSGWQSQVATLRARLPGLQLDSRRLAFIGDSITASWDLGLFGQFYANRAPILLGVAGDGTQGLLARLPDEWGPMRPRLAVLLIGTNNIAFGAPPENVALGIAEVVRMIHARSSGTRVLIIGILPRGMSVAEPLRAAAARVNELAARCADGQTTFYIDIGRSLLSASGELSPEVSFDSLHLTPVGYAIMAMALEPEIRRIMNE